ncbi:hypothetical protein Trydic_g10978 [Trypoxylus dichotomus]
MFVKIAVPHKIIIDTKTTEYSQNSPVISSYARDLYQHLSVFILTANRSLHYIGPKEKYRNLYKKRLDAHILKARRPRKVPLLNKGQRGF